MKSSLVFDLASTPPPQPSKEKWEREMYNTLVLGKKAAGTQLSLVRPHFLVLPNG
jgi:hypothetical protein